MALGIVLLGITTLSWYRRQGRSVDGLGKIGSVLPRSSENNMKKKKRLTCQLFPPTPKLNLQIQPLLKTVGRTNHLFFSACLTVLLFMYLYLVHTVLSVGQ